MAPYEPAESAVSSISHCAAGYRPEEVGDAGAVVVAGGGGEETAGELLARQQAGTLLPQSPPARFGRQVEKMWKPGSTQQ